MPSRKYCAKQRALSLSSLSNPEVVARKRPRRHFSSDPRNFTSSPPERPVESETHRHPWRLHLCWPCCFRAALVDLRHGFLGRFPILWCGQAGSGPLPCAVLSMQLHTCIPPLSSFLAPRVICTRHQSHNIFSIQSHCPHSSALACRRLSKNPSFRHFANITLNFACSRDPSGKERHTMT